MTAEELTNVPVKKAGRGLAFGGNLGVGLPALVERFLSGFHRRLRCFRNDPFHFAGPDFVLRDTARFTRTGFDYRRSAAPELAGTASGHEDVAIVAVEAFDQLHNYSPAA
jgi:hypothetical protein